MELVNATRLAAAYTLGIDPSGREHLVVAVKGTFDVPSTPDGSVVLSAQQVPIFLADELGGESGVLPICDADLCLRKPKCDVILKASAHAPMGRPTGRVQVGVRVGNWTKSFHVTGNRYWSSSGRASTPVPFEVSPITYEGAFGGAEIDGRQPERSTTYRWNPLGRGYRAGSVIDETPMPNTEELNDPVVRPNGDYKPMAFGPVGRNWFPRYTFAGTYDDDWKDRVFPFLPNDFDDRYHQAAPEDQQIPHLVGGEDVVLLNLSPDGRLAFRLPEAQACITVAPRYRDRQELAAVIDTIVIEPTERRFTLCWRASLPLRRNIFEIDEVVVGRVGSRFMRERDGLPLPFPASADRQRSSETP
jgi:hypothetical protein